MGELETSHRAETSTDRGKLRRRRQWAQPHQNTSVPWLISFIVLTTLALVARSRVPAFRAHTMPLGVRRISVTRRAIDEAVTGSHGSLNGPPATPGPSAQQRPDLLWFESSVTSLNVRHDLARWPRIGKPRWRRPRDRYINSLISACAVSGGTPSGRYASGPASPRTGSS